MNGTADQSHVQVNQLDDFRKQQDVWAQELRRADERAE